MNELKKIIILSFGIGMFIALKNGVSIDNIKKCINEIVGKKIYEI